ncbi:hypothetical protein PR202_ga22080 [Eleusine coracana subsp. coracana]|uniref:Uncharacterized protein n=1 Tax=Eleusine coracana subsp. coracana TaxID=191504 RepID=A0AAV5D1M9_ELECO|nr:hypothetical protein PR202_ga22080 [Eleusine coracana subsp. coracana]
MSTLLIGPSTVIVDDGSCIVIQSISFVHNPPGYPSYIYLNLMGISTGTTVLSIPAIVFDLNLDDSTGRLIIDSGSTTTMLVDIVRIMTIEVTPKV